MNYPGLIRMIVVLSSISAAGFAQQTSARGVTPKSVTQVIQIDNAQVVYVSGDDVVLKSPDGRLQLLELDPGTSLTVDGKPVAPKDLTPGTMLSHIKVNHMVESDVTTVTQIDGQIMQVSPPKWVTIKLGDGTVKRYEIPEHATFRVDGKEATAFELKKGMNLSATVVTIEGLQTHSKAGAVVGETPLQTGTLLILRRDR